MAPERFDMYEATPAWASNPMDPVKKENARVEIQHKAAASMRKSVQKLPMVMTQSLAHRPTPVDVTALYTQPQAQDLAALSGARNTLPTNVPDRADVRVNMLRYQRHTSYTDAIPREGGRLVGNDTLSDNWVEERRDASYQRGWHPKELRLNKLWDSEYTSSFVMHDPDYATRTLTTQAVAYAGPQPSMPGASLKGGDDKALLYYGRHGFGSKPLQDHTSAGKRGTHWVGIAAARDGESVTSTTRDRHEHLEFQTRSSSDDAKAKLLGAVPNTPAFTRPLDKWTVKAFDDLTASQRWASTWTTMYQRDFGGPGTPPPTFTSLRGRGMVTGTGPFKGLGSIPPGTRPATTMA